MTSRTALTRNRALSNLNINENNNAALKPVLRKPLGQANGLAIRAFGKNVNENALLKAIPKAEQCKVKAEGVENAMVPVVKPTIAIKPNVTRLSLSKIPKIASKVDLVSKPPVNTLAFSSLTLPSLVEDIDKGDEDNVLLESAYVKDIYEYLKQLEASQTIKQNFLSIQREMTPKMRSVLVDWLINVHNNFKLLPETLYMGVSLMDRFFQKEAVSKDKIQLVGVTAFFIASKFEEIYPPDLMDFVVICDKLYSKKEIIKMEMVMLRVLKFELARPLPLHFLRRNSKAAHADAKIHTLAKYLMELTLLDHECSPWPPSQIAAAALYVTLKVLNNDSKSSWNETLAFYTRYTEEEILPYAAHICKVLRANEKSKFENIRKKYESSKQMAISKSADLQSPVIDDLAASV